MLTRSERAGVLPGSVHMHITVEDQQGGTLRFRTKGNARISRLYELCTLHKGLPRHAYTLRHRGETLRDGEWTVDEYQILDGDKLELTLRQVGEESATSSQPAYVYFV